MKSTLINKDWCFFKGCASIEEIASKQCEKINLPHTWNNLDGQDGGSDYYRGKCFYRKKLTINKEENKDYYLEFEGFEAALYLYPYSSSVLCVKAQL